MLSRINVLKLEAENIQSQKENDEKDPEEAANMPADLRRLIKRQKASIGVLRGTLADIAEHYQTQDIEYVKLKEQLIRQYWEETRQTDRSIWELSDEETPLGYNMSCYLEIENQIQGMLLNLTQTLKGLKEPTAKVSVQMKLPKISLPKFDGDYLKWQQFYDLFTQMVDNQPIHDAQKLWYLKTNLTGEAEGLLRNLTASDNNYITAWNILKNRYNNRRLLISAILDRLHSQHTLTTESAIMIKKMHDLTSECLMSLRNLNVDISTWDPMILYHLLKKLDQSTHNLFVQSLKDPKEPPTVKEFLDFLEVRFQALETYKGAKSAKSQAVGKPLTLLSSTQGNCKFCKGHHLLQKCEKFLKLSKPEKWVFVRKSQICYNCLKQGHSHTQCRSRNCLKCPKKHHTLLHNQASAISNTDNQSATRKETKTKILDELDNSNEVKSVATNLAAQNVKSVESEVSQVLLATARVQLRDVHGNSVLCRAIIDTGSQVNLVTEKLAHKLRLKAKDSNIEIAGIGSSRIRTRHRIHINLESLTTNYKTPLEVFVVPKIADSQPQQIIDTSAWNIPQNIKLADPDFYKPRQVDLLIGAELAFNLLSVGQIKLSDDLPILQNTILGWIIVGKTLNPDRSTAFCGITNVELEEQLNKFWEVEEGVPVKILSKEENECERMFETTVKREDDGRFLVKLPFVQSPALLGNSRDIAFKRFMCLERKLLRDSELHRQYSQFIQEYMDLGHMEEIKPDSIPGVHCFLPHHGVLKPSSTTTKLRVVFDASAKTSNNLSLNDIMMKGPRLQDDLFSIILRFRNYKYAFTTDIQKMYRQIWVAEQDRNLQLIMWRQNPGETLKYYKLKTITYGTKAAPYLATKCLQTLAMENEQILPLGAMALKNAYMDDILAGSNDLQTAIQMRDEVTTILRKGGFELRKWCASDPSLIQGIPEADLEVTLDFNMDKEEQIKTLGLIWQPKEDLFVIKIDLKPSQNITKRRILSDISQLFDPLGLVNPVVVWAKIFMQQLWQLKLDWDASLPLQLHSQWLRFRDSLQKLNGLKFPRYISCVNQTIEMHAFADASEKAYGAAIYVKSTDQYGQITVTLLCAKSRVAPIKKQTLPRLELCAAKLAAELTNRIKIIMNWTNVKSVYWTDSQIVLSWLRQPSGSLKTFVANRLSAVQELTDIEDWRHVPSKLNPADLVSRGLYPEEIAKSSVWFYGPAFLLEDEQKWPIQRIIAERIEEEERPNKLVLINQTGIQTDHFVNRINHRNSFSTLKRVTAYILRAVKLFSNKDEGKPRPISLTVEELHEAMVVIVKNMQETAFVEDISRLRQGLEMKKDSQIINLTPFLDEEGILRVGGRLQNAELAYDAKHQMILPYAHPWSRLIIKELHLKHCHVGPQTLLGITRQWFWILRGKLLIRSVVHECIRCARVNPKSGSQIMGNLPADRVRAARPFLNAGVDFCGPVWAHFKIRGRKPQKAYICIFCCFATKAVHIELVSDLTTDAFIKALKRFLARRGRCKNLYCDNATNFVGAKNQLEELRQVLEDQRSREKIERFCTEQFIQFHFIPPRSPHFGGLWEAAVKSAKQLLIRACGLDKLTHEELNTILAEIEAILNSRPLTPISNDPSELSALTPGHFIIGEPFTSLIEPQVEMRKLALLERWKLLSQIKREFWERWSKEYLCILQPRYKWKEKKENMQEGMMVLIKGENTTPLKWPLGRIIKIHEGNDEAARVVDVKTSNGVLRRAIQNLCPLPMIRNEDEGIMEGDEKGETPQGTRSSDKEKESKRKMDVDTDNREHKKKPKRNTNALGLLLMTALLLPTFSTANAIVETTPLAQKPGIYYEKIGISNTIASEWDLIVYFNLSNYWKEFKYLEQGLYKLRECCLKLDGLDGCNNTLKLLEEEVEQLNERNEILWRHSMHLKGQRLKRGAFNILGQVANKLFGVLDNEYAEQMSATIDGLKQNDNRLLNLIQNQTSIVESAINVFRKDKVNLQTQFKLIKTQTEELMQQQSNMQNNMRWSSLMNSLTTHVALVINHYKGMQETLLKMATQLHPGILSTNVISADQLKDEAIKLQKSLPSTLRLPGLNDEVNLLKIYRLMTTEASINEKYIIFRIKVPLVNKEEMEVFHLTNVPVFIGNRFYKIAETADIMLINTDRSKWLTMTRSEFQQCEHFEENYYLCKPREPFYKIKENLQDCEVAIFNHQADLSSCKRITMNHTKSWKQLWTANQWIYTLSASHVINVVCSTAVIQRTLTGVGLLKLSENCLILDEDTLIQSHKAVKSSFNSTSYLVISEFNIPNTSTLAMQNTYRSTEKAVDDATADNNVNNLLQEIASLKESSKSLPTDQTIHTLHPMIISYIGLSLILLVLIVWSYSIIKRKCKPGRGARWQPDMKQQDVPSSKAKNRFKFELEEFKGPEDVQVNGQ